MRPPSTPTGPQSLASILRKPGVRRRPFLVRSPDDALLAARSIGSEALAPIFLTGGGPGPGASRGGGRGERSGMGGWQASG